MGLTRYTHGIEAHPVVGAGLGYGWKDASSIYFVDGTDGSDDQNGTSPEKAFRTIYQAIARADKWDVIYIMPKDWTSGNLWLGTAYTESSSTYDLSIAYAKQGVAMIGVGHQGLAGQAYGVVLREATSSTGSILKVYAPMCAIENLAFERYSTETGGAILFNGNTDGTYEGALGSVYNCHFHGINGTAGESPGWGGAIQVSGAWGATISNCSFLGCRVGVMARSSGSTMGNLTVQGCVFRSRLASAASDIGVDIIVYTQGSANILIKDNYFAHLIPSLSYGGSNAWINITADVRQGLIANNHFAGAVGTTYTQGYLGTGIYSITNVGLGANYCNGALMPVVSA